MATVEKGKILRRDLNNWDGVSKTATRNDSSGGTITGVTIGDAVDVLQVYGAGTAYTLATMNSAKSAVGSNNVSFVFATGTWTVTDDITIPANITCLVPAGCVFSITSGKTLTFSGHVHTEHATWTSGSGTLALSGTGSGALLSSTTLTTEGDAQIGLKRTDANAEATTVDNFNEKRHIIMGVDYGATLSLTNGTDDWSTVLANAMAIGEPIIFGPGLYNVTATTVPDGAVLIGLEGATFTDTGNTVDCLEIAGSAVIRGFSFTGFRYDIDINGAAAGSDIDISDCTFTSDQRGISGDRAGLAEVLCGRLRVSNCKFDSMTEYGIFTRKQGWDSVSIKDNYMHDFSSTGICVGIQVGHSVETTTNPKITQVTIADNTCRAFHTTNADALSDPECQGILIYCNEYTVTGNKIRALTTDATNKKDCEGINARGVYGVISNNILYDACPSNLEPEGSIVCKGSERVTVANNEIYYSAGAKAGADGMTVNAEEAHIIGNRIENADNGIRRYNGDNCTIKGNNIYNTVTGVYLNHDYVSAKITDNTMDTVSTGVFHDDPGTGKLIIRSNDITNLTGTGINIKSALANSYISDNDLMSDPTDTSVFAISIASATADNNDDHFIVRNNFIGFDTSGRVLSIGVTGLTIARVVFDHNTLVDVADGIKFFAGTITELWIHFNNAVDCTDPYDVTGTVTTENKANNIGTWT